MVTNNNGHKRLLSIKKIPIISGIEKHIVCIADDITTQHFLEKEMLISLKNIFKEKNDEIDFNLSKIKQTLDDSRQIVTDHLGKNDLEV